MIYLYSAHRAIRAVIFAIAQLSCFRFLGFLADRTNGCAYATVLRPSVVVVCRLSVTLCIVAKRCVVEQKLLLRAYRKSYVRIRLNEMNDPDLFRGRIKVASTIALYLTLNISETVRDRGFVPNDYQ